MTVTQVRVFISSTFAGFVSEREHLARALPAALRRRLSSRAIEVSLIDLRWGITEDQLRESGVIRTCLRAVERSSPYFVGLVGDQYGTVPNISGEDIDAFPWLEGMDGRSITELEILHGAINSGNVNAIFVDTSHEEGTDPRVQRLRTLIASSGAAVLTCPPDLDAMLTFIVEQLARALERDVPVDEEPLKSLIVPHPPPFFAREHLRKSLASLIQSREPVVWIHGPSGAGKSALLAQAIEEHGADIAVAVFPDDVDLPLLHHELASIWKALNPDDELAALRPMDVREFRARLEKFASASDKGIVLVWDNAPFEWFNLHANELLVLPRNVRTIVTARELPPGVAKAGAFPVKMPTGDEVHAFVTGKLATVGRTLAPEVARELVAVPAMRDYHFASIALDELMFASAHARLADDARKLARAAGLDALVRDVIGALSEHFGDNQVASALETVFLNEEPLSEKVLQALIGVNDLRYSSLRAALSGAFEEHSAGVALRSSYRRALALSPRNKKTARHDLADRFLQISPPRPMDAMHQYFRAGDPDRVMSLFEDAAFSDTDGVDIVHAAPWLRWATAQGAAIEATFLRLLDKSREADSAALPRITTLAVLCDLVLPGSSTADAWHVLVKQMGGQSLDAAASHRLAGSALARGEWTTAVSLSIDALVGAVGSKQDELVLGILSTLSAAVASEGSPRIAECWLNAALELLGQSNDRDAVIEATLQSNLGQVYKSTNRADMAVSAAQRAVDLRRKSGAYDQLPLGLANLGSVQMAAGQGEMAFANLSEAWELATKLSLSNRGNIAALLLSAQGRRKKRIKALFNSLERSLEEDAHLRVSDVVDFYISAAMGLSEQGERRSALQALDKAEARLRRERSNYLRQRVDELKRLISDKRNWTWTGGFRGWKRQEFVAEPERLWALFDTREYARFLLRGSLLAVASDNGEAIIVISKSVDDLDRSPIDGIDWAALRTGVGPPPSEHEYIVVYSAGGRFLAFWMPVIPVNPIFIAGFNAVIAATVPALDDAAIGTVHTKGDDWTRVLRRLIEARKAYGDSPAGKTEIGTIGTVDRGVCTYFPRLETFEVAERIARDGLVFSWLANTVSAQSMDYPAVLWVESEKARPVMYSDAGEGLGVPVLALALEISAGTDRFAKPFFGVFTPDGHRTLGVETIEGFRSRSWQVALEFLQLT